MDLGLAHARAILVGGGFRLGRGIAELLVAEGASVAVCARRRESVEATVTASNPQAFGSALDLTDRREPSGGWRLVEDRRLLRLGRTDTPTLRPCV